MLAKHRKLIDDCLYELENTIWNEEELTYCITQLIHMYLKKEHKVEYTIDVKEEDWPTQ